MGHFEARLEVEVDNREAMADNSLASYSVARMERSVDSTLAGNKAHNRFPDEAEGRVAGRNNRKEDMFDNASDAWIESNRAVEDVAHIGRAVSVLSRHLFD